MAQSSLGTNCGGSKRLVKLYYTSYSEDFYNERESLKKQIVPDLISLCDHNGINLKCYSIKWGGDREKRDVLNLEKLQTSIENCYYDKITTIFINFTRSVLPQTSQYFLLMIKKNSKGDSLCWVPMWCDYPESLIETYMEVYSLLFEDFDVMKEAYKPEHANSLFLIRNDSFLEQVPGEERGMFTSETDVSKKLWEQGDHISKNFPSYRIHRYDCNYIGTDTKKQTPKLDFGVELRNKIIDFVKDCLHLGNDFTEGCSSANPFSIVRNAHHYFMEQGSETVFGREDVMHSIEEYITQRDKDMPLLLLGNSGEGKTSVMCKAARHIQNKIQSRHLQMLDSQNWTLFSHFVAAVPDSRSINSMLQRLLVELDVDKEGVSTKSSESLTQHCHSLLSSANTRPLIIFIDAFDQFMEDPVSTVMAWLPRKLAPQVRCIFSMTCGSGPHVTLKKRETKPIELTLPLMDIKTRQCIVTHLTRSSNHPLNSEQLSHLLNKCANSLWVSIACEELLLSNEPIPSLIHRFPDTLTLLVEQVLSRLECSPHGMLIIATLCLLQASLAGLLKSELLTILGNNLNISPPSPFDEKEEKETSEKSSSLQRSQLSANEWNAVYSVIERFLCPYGNDSDGRLDFSHPAVSEAVMRKYLPRKERCDGDNDVEGIGVCYLWWHKVLADHFENVDSFDRYIDEYPYQLSCIDDKWRLSKCLCKAKVFDALYSDEYSGKLLSYWRKVGSASEMVAAYRQRLCRMETEVGVSLEDLSLRYEKVCRIVLQSGKFLESLELLKTAMKIEERELGARPERMVELYALMAEIYDEKLKLNDFVSRSQLPDLRKTVTYGRKSIGLRKQFSGDYHKFKLAMSLMKLSFSLECWEACGGGQEMSGEEALAEGNKYIDIAIQHFQELNDMGHYAEALMTKGVLAPRGSMEQLKLYNEAKDLCMQVYGEYHILSSRLYINIGIVYEDRGQYERAYKYFKVWAKVSEEIFGADHPKTQRARGVLKERRYRRIAQTLGDWDYDQDECSVDDNDADMQGSTEEESIVDLYDDIVQACVNLRVNDEPDSDEDNRLSDNTNHDVHRDTRAATGIGECPDNRIAESMNNQLMLSSIAHQRLGSDSDTDDELSAAFFDEDRDNIENDDDGGEENLDDNSYDDNFEDYDEQYIMHLDDAEPNIEDFNVEHNHPSVRSSYAQRDWFTSRR